MDGTGDHHVKQNNPDSEKQISFSLICRIQIFLKRHQSTRGTTRKE
jgi:hypothetical protein